MTFYQERVRQVILPGPEAKRVLLGDDRHCNSGQGPFDNGLAATCYCICQAPMHYASYTQALNERFGAEGSDPLPGAPLVVDLGCGPATTLFALGDWLYGRRARTTSVGFIGIDTSEPLLRIAAAMTAGAAPFAAESVFVMRRAVDELSDTDIRQAAQGRDGVIFALSYVLHHAFMWDMTLLASLMRRIRPFARRLPTWLLAQDANFPDRPDEHTEVWPESRLNVLANRCEAIGYTISSWKTKFVAPRVRITPAGEFRTAPAGETQNACHFFQRIA